MILVKSVDIEHVSGREAQIAITNPIRVPCKDYSPSRVNYSNETVQARVFMNSKREEVIVGFSLKVQEALGMPMDAFQGMNQDIERLTLEVKKNKHELVSLVQKQMITIVDLGLANLKVDEYKSASFFKRLKYLFGGKL